jgi:hypothetical protein
MRRSNGQQVLTKYSMRGKGEEEEIWLNFVGTCMEECLQRDNGSALTSNSNRYLFIALPYTSDSYSRTEASPTQIKATRPHTNESSNYPHKNGDYTRKYNFTRYHIISSCQLFPG